MDWAIRLLSHVAAYPWNRSKGGPMGIIHKIKRRLPIVGAGGSAPTTRPTPSAPSESTASQAAPAEPKAQMVSETEAVRDGSEQSVHDFISELVKSNKIVLFMKGSPLSPSCGFSANAAGIAELLYLGLQFMIPTILK